MHRGHVEHAQRVISKSESNTTQFIRNGMFPPNMWTPAVIQAVGGKPQRAKYANYEAIPPHPKRTGDDTSSSTSSGVPSNQNQVHFALMERLAAMEDLMNKERQQNLLIMMEKRLRNGGGSGGGSGSGVTPTPQNTRQVNPEELDAIKDMMSAAYRDQAVKAVHKDTIASGFKILNNNNDILHYDVVQCVVSTVKRRYNSMTSSSSSTSEVVSKLKHAKDDTDTLIAVCDDLEMVLS